MSSVCFRAAAVVHAVASGESPLSNRADPSPPTYRKGEDQEGRASFVNGAVACAVCR